MSTLADFLRAPVGRGVKALLATVAIATSVVAWFQLGRITGLWRALLVVGTAATIIGLIAAAQDRLRLSGGLLLLAAISLPTGLAAILNVILAVLALPLLVLGGGKARERERRS